jgi:hypothetical protein
MNQGTQGYCRGFRETVGTFKIEFCSINLFGKNDTSDRCIQYEIKKDFLHAQIQVLRTSLAKSKS